MLSLGSTGMLPRVGRASDSGGGRALTGGLVSPSGLPKVAEKVLSPPPSPQPSPGLPPRLAMPESSAAAGASDSLQEGSGVGKGSAGLHVPLQLDGKLQGLVSKWENQSQGEDNPRSSVLYKLLR